MASGIQRRKEEKKNEEEKKMEKFEAFHNEKMKVFEGMLEVLRGLKEKWTTVHVWL